MAGHNQTAWEEHQQEGKEIRQFFWPRARPLGERRAANRPLQSYWSATQGRSQLFRPVARIFQSNLVLQAHQSLCRNQPVLCNET